MSEAFIDPGYIPNPFCPRFLRCTSSALAQFYVLKLKQAYYGELTEGYIDALSTLTKNMYRVVVNGNYRPHVTSVGSNKVKNIANLLNHCIQDILARGQGFTNVSDLPSSFGTPAGSSPAHY